ncbi:MAG TPA: hypothetical protein VGI95_14810 [Caulobacteraceae bacterium]|jgi:modulator of FtsH protease
MIVAAQWQGFFTAAAGASGALVGLIFVALSVNIREILKYDHLAPRGAAALSALMLILVTSLCALAPQPGRLFGAEVAVFGLAAWSLQIRAALQSHIARRTHGRPDHEAPVQTVLGQVQIAPFLAGAALFAAGGDGVGWLVGGTVAVFILAVIDAWVLLVEILR